MSQRSQVLDPWPDLDTVPVIDVARAAGVPRYDVRKVELAGLVKHAGRLAGPGVGRGRGGTPTLTHDDAVFVFRCALIAVMAGVAVVTVARVMRGIDAGPDALAALLRTGKAGGAVAA